MNNPGVSLRAAIRSDIKSMNRGMELAPAVMGVQHPQTVRNYTCDTKHGVTAMNLDQFEAVVEWTGGRHAAAAIAEMAGGIFVPVDPQEIDQTSLLAEITATVQRLGELMNTIQQAVADERVSNAEWRDVQAAKRKLYEQQHRLVSLVASMRV